MVTANSLRVFALIGCLLFFTRPVVAQEEKTGGAARLESWKLNRAMAESSPYRDVKWEAMGPKFAGGRIEAVDCPKGNSGTIYAAVGAGGVWKTINGGLTWKPVFQNQSTFSVGDITIAPSNPDIIWVGSGECHLSRSSYEGNGVFKSTDGGESWTNMGLVETAHIGRIAIDPNDPDIVFVAAMGRLTEGGDNGVFRTTDGGKSFHRVLHEEGKVAFVDLVIDPSNSRRIYATSWDRGGGRKGGVYKSEDQGESWTRLEGGLLVGDVDRIALDVSASEPGVVYALITDRASPELGRRRNASILFRSSDYGETWKRTHADYVPTYVGWDFCDLRVAPDDANRVYIGGLRLIVSTDGGKTFEGEGGFAVNRKKDEVFRLHHHRGTGMHLDVHEIWIDPENPERVLLGNDGGLYVSWDRGATWLHLNNLPIAEFYRIHLDNQTPFNIWGGTQDNASFVGPSTARLRDGEEDSWQQVFLDPWTGGDGFATFPDPLDPEVTYYTQQMGDLKRSRLGNLSPEKSIRPRAAGNEKEPEFAWDTPFFASIHQTGRKQGQTLLYCAAQRVYRSVDCGNSWTAISGDLSGSPLLALAESPLDNQRLAAGGGRGNVTLTSDGGVNWFDAGAGLPEKTIRDIVLSCHDPDRVYVVLSGGVQSDCQTYVFLSEDFGKSWKSLAANLPPESANALAEDPENKSLVFLGTDLGVYVSTTGGQHWESLCWTFPTAPVVDLAVHGRDGALVAATHGLSIFITSIDPIRKAVSVAEGD